MKHAGSGAPGPPAEGARLLVIPDTNYFMHGQSLDKLTPEVFGHGKAPTWVFVSTVIKEVDEKTHHPNSRLSRRAKSARQRILDAYKTRPSNTLIFDPRPRPAYADLELAPDDADDRIIGHAIALAKAFPQDEVKILSLDAGMHIRALQYGVGLVDEVERFREADDEDSVERELRLAREELRRQSDARPVLTIAIVKPKNGTLAVVPAPSATIEDLVRTSVVPESDDHHLQFSAFAAFEKEVDNYSELLAQYEIQLTAFLEASVDRLTIHEICFSIINAGLVSAADVNVKVFAPAFAIWLSEMPEELKAPKKPGRYKFPGEFNFFDINQRYGTSWLSRPVNLRALDFVSPTRETVTPTTVTFSRRAFPQRDAWQPHPVYLKIPVGSPKNFDFKYEIRIGNGFDVQTGSLLVQSKQLSKRRLFETLWTVTRVAGDEE
jgi:hypothetical protein